MSIATKPMSMPDKVFLSFDSDREFTHFASVSTFRSPEGAPAGFVADLVDRLRSAQQFAEPFNWRISRGVRRRWDILSDRDINLGHHVVHSALPSTERLDPAVGRALSHPLDPTKPLWELHVIEGPAEGRFALCMKMHHALMDGLALANLHCSMTSADPTDDDLRPFWSIGVTDASPLGTGGRTRDVVRELSGQARQFVREARNPTDPAFAVPMGCPRSPILNGRISRQRSFATQLLDGDRVAALAAHAGMSINEFLLAAVSGALRNYLAFRRQLPERSLIAGVPALSRSEIRDSRHSAGAMILVNLFTDQRDPVERLRGIARSSTIAKSHLGAVSAKASELYAVLTFGPFMVLRATGLVGRTKSPFNVTVSGVLPGPREQRYLLGAPQDALFGSANLGDGALLSITVVSENRQLCVGFTGCGDALPDIDRIAAGVADEITELESALAIKRGL